MFLRTRRARIADFITLGCVLFFSLSSSAVTTAVSLSGSATGFITPSFVQKIVAGGSFRIVDVQVDGSNNIYMLGETGQLLKYDTQKNVLFSKQYTGPAGVTLYGMKMKILSSGKIGIVGIYSDIWNSLNYGLFLRVNNNGTIDLAKSYSGPTSPDKYEQFIGLDEFTDGSIAIVGKTASYGGGSDDALLMEISTTGTITWQRTYGGVNAEVCNGVDIDSSNNIYISCSAPEGGFLAKINSAGTLQWSKRLFSTDSKLSDAYLASDGQIVVAGRHAPSSENGMVAKVDSNGNSTWAKNVVLGSASEQHLWKISEYTSGNIAVSGYLRNANLDGAIVGLSLSTGSLNWGRSFGGTGSEYFNWGLAYLNIAPGYLLVGGDTMNSFGNAGYNGYFLKLNTDGTPADGCTSYNATPGFTVNTYTPPMTSGPSQSSTTAFSVILDGTITASDITPSSSLVCGS